MPKLFHTLDRVKPFYDALYKIILLLCKLLLVADILITSYAVFGRLVGGIQLPDGQYLRNAVSFIDDPSWSEEVVLTLMSYMAVLSAALAIRRGAHIRMTALDNYLPKKLVMTLDVLADVFVLLLGLMMLVVGWKYATGLGGRGFYVSLPKLSKFWQYFPVPLAGAVMIVFELEQIVDHIKAFFVAETSEEKEDK